jgi:hypothetical protein
MVPLCAALLSLPLPAQYPPLSLRPQRQRQKTLEALLTWLLQETVKHPVLFVMEDLHWVDPSTLDFLRLLVDQGPTARILVLLTCRPEFTVPWVSRTHLTQITLTRLPKQQVERMMASVAREKALPLEVVDKNGERFYEAELYRLKGELLLRPAIPDEHQAEASFHQALTIARHQQAKLLELRAAMSLARLWQRQGKRAEAHRLLAEIYGWFTEGFDTADLREARTLLEELT